MAQTEEVYEEDEPESYFLGLQEQEMDYPAQAPQDQEIQWGSTDKESEAYWQQVVQHVEQIEAQLPLANDWYNPTLSQDTIIEEFLDRIPQGMPEGTWYEIYDNTKTNEVNNAIQLSNDITNISIYHEEEIQDEQEVAHVNTEQLQQLEYSIFRRLAQSLSKEKALASTSESAISNYKQPNEPLVGQINYPPTQGTTPQFNDNGPYKGKFKGKVMEHNTWTLPSAQQNTEVMLVLPEDIDTMRIHCITCRMTACPSCSKYYLRKTIQYKETPMIPPYQKQDDIIRELLDYTQHLQANLTKQKGKSIIIDTDDDERQKFLPFYPEQEEKKVTFEFLKIKRMTETTKIPERRTAGVAGYDLFIDQAAEIPARERMLIKTRISMEFPEGYYAKLTERSGATLRRKISIGAGVIDADYRDTKVQTILDTGATKCCICKEALPQNAFEEISYKVVFSGINSQQETKKKMSLKDEIQMLLGCNFIRTVAGGLRIEGSEITFYRSITIISTTPEVNISAYAIPELEMEEDEFITLGDELNPKVFIKS
ncbi:hypothetical protein ZIOFF_070442 [Zingiber officinale]|uniref:dUTP diphosphatase n=1 Tax=Zingiber officinale TaxID=94328 RepID=A0A8J5CD32_ZINOF|nr:hypothetical protein ZIOFF_070442 [Zingiber officinale]